MSWALYLWYRVEPHALTMAGFESAFPLLAWQLLFVHGIAIGYHRNDVSAFVARMPTHHAASGGARRPPASRSSRSAIRGLTVRRGFTWASCRRTGSRPCTSSYFTLSDLRVGRLLNLSIALPVAYVMLTRYWALARPLETVFVVLGQRSLGAFVLHVYGLLLLAHLPLPDGIWINTLAQVTLVFAIATLLTSAQSLRYRGRRTVAGTGRTARRVNAERACH